jgi:hypothetical protein
VRPETFHLTHAQAARRLIMRLMGLTFDRPWKVTIERIDSTRTLDQNAKWRAMVRDIAEHTGEDPDRMHEVLLAERFGTERVELGNGKHMDRPARRSSELTKQEMADLITWGQAFAARVLGLELV